MHLLLLFFFLLLAEVHPIALQIELAEGRRVDLYDRILHERLCPDQLVVARVVDNLDDLRLACDGLGSPGEVAVVETKRSELLITASRSKSVNALGPELGHAGLSAHLVALLLAMDGHAASCCSALVSAISGNPHLD